MGIQIGVLLLRQRDAQGLLQKSLARRVFLLPGRQRKGLLDFRPKRNGGFRIIIIDRTNGGHGFDLL